jgi:ABC-type multidrug transport system fused ATPase/permease subunit
MNEMMENIKENDDVNEDKKKEYIFKNGDIEVKNVGFSYDRAKIFNNFSLNIP